MVVSLRRIVIMRSKALRWMLLIRLISITFVQILMFRLLCFVITLTIIMVLTFHQSWNRRRLGSS